MAEPERAARDPSMDDILASIRKIISEDDAKARNRPAAGTARDDVLLLTNPIEESSVQTSPSPTLSDQPHAGESPSDPPLASQRNQGPSPEPPAARPQGGDFPLLGTTVAGAASSALDRLQQAVAESVPVPSAPDPGPTIASGGKTVEDLVKEMLRPMLKEWLDSNLPPMVERYVEREIVRLARR